MEENYRAPALPTSTNGWADRFARIFRRLGFDVFRIFVARLHLRLFG